jgi:hypothetical protein
LYLKIGIEKKALRKKKMVASSQANNNASNKNSNIQFSSEALNLNDWIKNLKSKKQFKRKISRGQDLRAIAMLQNSLLTNLKMLRQRQRERSEKWSKIKKMLEINNNCDNLESKKCEEKTFESLEKELNRKEEIQKIFKEDLSDIDDFMNNLDSIKTALVR